MLIREQSMILNWLTNPAGRHNSVQPSRGGASQFAEILNLRKLMIDHHRSVAITSV
jgi:hypothetical protein